MIPSIPQPKSFHVAYGAYVLMFFIYLVAPLVVVAIFAFNDSMFPSLPWNGTTLDWFFNDTEPRLGLFHDRRLLSSIWNSFVIACWVTVLSVSVGTTNAFLFERREFPLKGLLYMVMLLPLVVPGVILGISILVFSSTIANWVEGTFGWDLMFLRPSTFLVVMGQFSFIATITTLVISARLRKFDVTLEEAAQSLGLDRNHSVPQTRHCRRGDRVLPDVVRKLQHHLDARRLRPTADDRHVRATAGRVDTRIERVVSVVDGGVGYAGFAQRFRATRKKLISQAEACHG